MVAALGVYCGEGFGWNLFTRSLRVVWLRVSDGCLVALKAGSSGPLTATADRAVPRKTRPCEQPNCAKCAVAVVPSLDFRNVTSDMMAVRYPPY